MLLPDLPRFDARDQGFVDATFGEPTSFHAVWGDPGQDSPSARLSIVI